MRNNGIPHPQEIAALSKPDAQHAQLLDGLHSINASLKALMLGREPFYQTVAISATVPIDLDYRDRKHIFIYSANALILSVEDLGSVTLSANTWTNMSFAPGTRIYATGQATVVYVAIKQTDDPMDAAGGSSGGGAVTAASGSYVAGFSPDITGILTDTADIELNTANIPPLGQALAGASTPVVLTAAQITTLTPPVAITGFALESGGNLANILTQTITTATDMAELLLDTDNLATIQSNTAAGATRQPVAGTTGGSTPYHLITAASNNLVSVKGSAGLLYGLSVSNNSASAIFFKLYNKATAPVVASDTPVRTIQVPANSTVITAFPLGMGFSSGIAYACTGAIPDADATNITIAGSIDLDYK